MKKRPLHVLLLLLFLVLSSCITLLYSCKKVDTPPGGGGNNTGYGNAMIWTKNGTLGYVTINCNGQSEVISKYYPTGGPSGCGVSGFANFELPVGTHSFTGSNAAGTTWSGSVTIKDGDCTLMEITSGGGTGGGGGGGGGGSSNKAQAVFFTYAATTPISVTVSGLTATITSKLSNGNVPACGAAGCATFDLGVGTHNWTATDGNNSWNGTVTVTLGGCKPVGLNAGSGGGGTGTGELIVFENYDHGNGTITVTCNGQTRYVTGYHPNAGISNPPPCGASGAANFTLSPGTYNVYASDPSGATWSRSMAVYTNGCSAMMLQ